MATSVASAFNTYVPSFDASGKLAIAYSRNVRDFPLNQYITLTPVKYSTGYYLRITPDNAARILNTDLAEFFWPDSHDAPTGEWNTEEFEFQQFASKRYNFPFRLGYKSVEQADWQILAYHAAMVAQQAMTGRTLRVLAELTNTASYPASHVFATATALGSGSWSAGTPTDPNIKEGLNKIARTIQLDTVGVIQPKDLVLIVNPVAADLMARSQEVHTYVKENPLAGIVLQKGSVDGNSMGPGNWVRWGLPEYLYGYKLVVEDTVRVSSKKGASSLTTGYALADNDAIVVARPGQLVNQAGGPSWSTVHVFSYEEMTVESKDDPDNRRHLGRVVEDYDVKVVSPVSGVLVQDIFS